VSLPPEAVRAIAEQAAALAVRLVERRIEAEHRRRQLRERAEAYLRAHPEASANAVHRAVGGNRADVLATVRALRSAASADGAPNPGLDPAEPAGPVLGPEYHSSDEGGAP
jgi:hypothetical protein